VAKHFRDLTEEQKASHSITEDARDESFVYCATCHRAMEQGDCVVDEDLEIKLRCAYSDCVLAGNIAAQSMHGWDDYRSAHEEETAHWPDAPSPGECYESANDSP
jgi:hypothetical protein